MRRIYLIILIIVCFVFSSALANADDSERNSSIPPYVQAELLLDDMAGYISIGCKNRYLLQYEVNNKFVYVRCNAVRMAGSESSETYLPLISK